MFLVTPDTGLLLWMVIIFGIVFFVLAKFGFPVITRMVEKRSEHIDTSLRLAREAQEKLLSLSEEQAALIEATKKEQARLLKEASETKDKIIAQAKEEAREEASIILKKARTEIEAEKESAIRDIRRQVAELSVEVAEKVVRENLSSQEQQIRLAEKMAGEISSAIPAGIRN